MRIDRPTRGAERLDRDPRGARAAVESPFLEDRLADVEPDRVRRDRSIVVSHLLSFQRPGRSPLDPGRATMPHAPDPPVSSNVSASGEPSPVASPIDAWICQHAGVRRIGQAEHRSPRRRVGEPTPRRPARAPDGADRRSAPRTRPARTACRRARSPARCSVGAVPAGTSASARQVGGVDIVRVRRGRSRRDTVDRRVTTGWPTGAGGLRRRAVDAELDGDGRELPPHASREHDERRRPIARPHHGSLSAPT